MKSRTADAFLKNRAGETYKKKTKQIEQFNPAPASYSSVHRPNESEIQKHKIKW